MMKMKLQVKKRGLAQTRVAKRRNKENALWGKIKGKVPCSEYTPR